jgi:hypothetical protein
LSRNAPSNFAQSGLAYPASEVASFASYTHSFFSQNEIVAGHTRLGDF